MTGHDVVDSTIGWFDLIRTGRIDEAVALCGSGFTMVLHDAGGLLIGRDEVRTLLELAAEQGMERIAGVVAVPDAERCMVSYRTTLQDNDFASDFYIVTEFIDDRFTRTARFRVDQRPEAEATLAEWARR